MNNLNFKIIILAGFLIAFVQQIVASIVSPFIPMGSEIAPYLGFIVGLAVSTLISFYMLKKAKLKGNDGLMQGFLIGVFAAAFVMLFYIILLGGYVKIFLVLSYIIGAVLGGHLARKK